MAAEKNETHTYCKCSYCNAVRLVASNTIDLLAAMQNKCGEDMLDCTVLVSGLGLAIGHLVDRVDDPERQMVLQKIVIENIFHEMGKAN